MKITIKIKNTLIGRTAVCQLTAHTILPSERQFATKDEWANFAAVLK